MVNVFTLQHANKMGSGVNVCFKDSPNIIPEVYDRASI